ncbi:hypothetical protein GOP47_0016925 [Adiantum capillus-veneris]|uniref:Protein kinase domain-containing protein n=1 Tax=Adiantum capillus-veneris TaxID=13818 RepID=A0A9D4UIQ4_ADICA|nr:hypothetical protein GOP47_0016925 [Adiantum capillus-veneris]
MSYGSSNMDDNDGTSEGIQTDVAGDNNWSAPLSKVSRNSGSASPSAVTVFGSKVGTVEGELEHRGVDYNEEEGQGGQDEFSFGQDASLFPMSASSPNENCEIAVHDADEVVVDVSPNAHSLDSLDTFIRKNSTASQVKGMYVYDNTFTVLPGSVSRFTNLRSLKIFSNEIKLLPDEVGSINLLENLQMKISPTGLGKFPPLGRLKFLKTLELHQTPLRPVFSLPSEISKLQLLTRLAVCNFSISFLPPEIGDLKNLEELDLSFNKLKTLPKEISSLLALKHFRAENNKLIDLPSGFAQLPNLSSVDIAHNKLTSLESLGLSLMPSLRLLNAKFNKLRTTGKIPDWVTCNLEGNPFSLGEMTSSSDGSEGILDTDLLPSATDGDEASSPAPVLVSQKETVLPKNGRYAMTKRGWKRQNIQQLQARQDRLNLSRNLKVEVSKDTDIVLGREGQADMEEPTSTFAGGDSHEVLLINETEVNVSDKRAPQIADYRQVENASEACFGNGSYSQKNHKHSLTAVSEIVDSDSVPAKASIRSYSSRKVISGDRENQNSCNESTGDANIVDGEDDKTFTFTSKLESDTVFVNSRRKGSGSDRNPKPAKRRRSAQGFSEVSYKYRSKSIVGLNDCLQDGFYDAGRDHPFAALEVLENEQLCFESREVILVDRDRDEELDVIAFSAQNFLSKLELAGEVATNTDSFGLSLLQKAMMLSLYVSDCFGGSDKTLNVTNARRAALGGCLDVPFLCSCSSTLGSSSNESNNNSIQGTVPTVHQLCETSARLLQAQRQSNVVPLGLLPYGVCRHRAILFKYLCDRASVPCELVRGYLDYVPHAWNVVLVKKADVAVRMLVDSCRPLDIREEKDSEYFCRYIPLRRFQLPSHERGNLEVVSEDIIPVLLDEIGRGASGSVVQRCTLGSVTAAAKVHMVDQASEEMHKVLSRFLSELRIFCSLREHPHIVSFYGHEFRPTRPDSSKHADDAMQLKLFMEYVPGVSLEIVLASYATDGQAHMPIKQAAFVSKAVAHALSFVHSKGIVHRDIKSSNVLIDLEGNWVASAPPVKLCDFDSAVPLASSSAHTCYLAHRGIPPVEVCVGTPRWMAPEVFQAMYSKRPYGTEADMWSFGCLIFEMLTLQVPYVGLPEAQIHAYIQAGRRPPLPAKFEQLVTESVETAANEWKSLSDEELKTMKGLVRLFNSCTESSASGRPTAHEALKSLSDLVNSFAINSLDVKVDNLDIFTKGDCRQMIDRSPGNLHRTVDRPQSLQDETDVSQTE